jgi:predicted nuclease of predicted toxin-antitoxin system
LQPNLAGFIVISDFLMSVFMTIWIDAQLSPSLALWINQQFEGIEAQSLWSLGLRSASDKEIFQQAKKADVILMSKDDDFARLVQIFGPPPPIILLTCGNTSNARMRKILSNQLVTVLDLIKAGEPLVEISGVW